MPTAAENDGTHEIQLLAAVGAGDREAFRELYRRYSAPLFSLALRFVADAGDAEEVLQDTFVKIWRHAGSYDARKSRPFTWAVTLLRRTCIDHLRRHRRTPPVTALPNDDGAPAEFSTCETTRRSAEMNEATGRLQGALTAVSSPQRDALELALFSTLTHAEIAARLSQPVGTIKTWIRRGLLDLRARLSELAP